MGKRSADGLVRAIKAGCDTRTKPSTLHFAKDSRVSQPQKNLSAVEKMDQPDGQGQADQ